MYDKLDIDEIIARNPQISSHSLQETGELLERLRALGVRRKQYNIASPYGRNTTRACQFGAKWRRTLPPMTSDDQR